MKLKIVAKKYLCSMLVMTCLISNVAFAGDFGFKKDIGIEKVWRVDLSSEVDENSLNDEHISLKDKSGKVVKCKYRLENEGKTIVVVPEHYYEYGQIYELSISNIKSTNQKLLSQEATMSFEVQDLSLEERKELLKKRIVESIDNVEGGIDVSHYRIPYEDFEEVRLELSIAGLLRGVMTFGSDSEDRYEFLKKYAKPGNAYAEQNKDFRGEPGDLAHIGYAYPETFLP